MRSDGGLLPAVAAACVVVAVLLAVQVAMDPNIEVTGSDSPFTDEGWLVLGALGAWLSSDWR